MRTRPDAQQEIITRRLALLRADSADDPADDPADDLAYDPVEDEAEWWGGHTTVVEADRPAEPVAQGSARPVVVPVPGRHAARRAVDVPRLPALPETLRGRVRLGPAQLAVVALALAAALALTCWWLARGRATALSTPVPPASSATPLVSVGASAATPPATAPVAMMSAGTSLGPSPGTSSASSPGAVVTVDVEGKVRRPGIVVLPTGSRVTDALKAAGGVQHRKALHGLNLAAVLVDGQQIMVGAATPVAGGGAEPGATSTAGAPGVEDAPVNLNTATADQLDTLPGVGPVTAQSILEWRDHNGGFSSVQDLLDVDGIGPATLAKLTPHVTV